MNKKAISRSKQFAVFLARLLGRRRERPQVIDPRRDLYLHTSGQFSGGTFYPIYPAYRHVTIPYLRSKQAYGYRYYPGSPRGEWRKPTIQGDPVGYMHEILRRTERKALPAPEGAQQYAHTESSAVLQEPKKIIDGGRAAAIAALLSSGAAGAAIGIKNAETKEQNERVSAQAAKPLRKRWQFVDLFLDKNDPTGRRAKAQRELLRRISEQEAPVQSQERTGAATIPFDMGTYNATIDKELQANEQDLQATRRQLQSVKKKHDAQRMQAPILIPRDPTANLVDYAKNIQVAKAQDNYNKAVATERKAILDQQDVDAILSNYPAANLVDYAKNIQVAKAQDNYNKAVAQARDALALRNELTGRGRMIGGLTGAGAGGYLGYRHAVRNNSGTLGTLGKILLGGSLGGAGGAALGHLIGGLVADWRKSKAV